MNPTPNPERLPMPKAMAIAIGIHCRDGIVIAADSQISVPGYYKFHESKIHHTSGDGWALLFGYSGAPGLYLEAREAIMIRFSNSIHTPKALFECCRQSLLDEMALRYTPDLELDMLIGVSCSGFDTRLLAFSGSEKSLHWEHGIRCIGVGDSSLTRYLSEALYDPVMTVDDASKIAVYIVAKAKSYIDHCGGDTILYALHGRDGLFHIRDEQVKIMESEMLAREKDCLRAIAGL
ncbi:MAG TPA: hypothetical protein VKV79_07275 [Terriglobia bacterium]|nr:hypothetical protein [Terriglobia bacterium]